MKLFSSLKEVAECYGMENLVPVTNLQQILFYVRRFGLQPKWIDESTENKGHIVCYYLKQETCLAYKKWKDNRPQSGVTSL